MSVLCVLSELILTNPVKSESLLPFLSDEDILGRLKVIHLVSEHTNTIKVNFIPSLALAKKSGVNLDYYFLINKIKSKSYKFYPQNIAQINILLITPHRYYIYPNHHLLPETEESSNLFHYLIIALVLYSSHRNLLK